MQKLRALSPACVLQLRREVRVRRRRASIPVQEEPVAEPELLSLVAVSSLAEQTAARSAD